MVNAVPKLRLIMACLAALVSTLVVAFVAGYLYPIVTGSVQPGQYVASTFSGDAGSLALALAVFVVIAIPTLMVVIAVLALVLVPVVYLSRSLTTWSFWTYLLGGIVVSLVVMGIFFVRQTTAYAFGDSDFHFALAVIAIDGPVAMTFFWSVFGNRAKP